MSMRTMKANQMRASGQETVEERFLRVWVKEVFTDKRATPRELQAADAYRRVHLGVNPPVLTSDILEGES